MKKFELFTTCLFLTIMACLCFNISRPARVDYEMYEETFNKSKNSLIADIEKSRAYIFRKQIRLSIRMQYIDLANHLDSITNDLYKYIDNTKKQFISLTDSVQPDFGKNQPQNIYTNRFFIRDEAANHLEDKIKNYIYECNRLVRYDSELIDPIVKWSIWNRFLSYSKDNHRRWCAELFNNQSVEASILLLNLFEKNVLNQEAFYMHRIEEYSHPHWCGYDSIFVMCTTRSVFTVAGGEVKYNLRLASISFHDFDSFTSNSGKVKNLDHYISGWTGDACKVGINTVTGTATRYLDVDSFICPWSFQYLVLARGATVLLDSTNICYRNMENPVTINVPGYSPAELSLRVSGAKVVKVSDGHYQIIPAKNTAHEIVAYVDAKGCEGIINTMSITRIKVKDVPTPYTGIGNSHAEAMAAGWFKSQKGINIIPFDPDFAMTYTVTSFEVDIKKQSSQHLETYEIHGPDFANNEAAADAISKLSSGDKVYISNVHAKTKAGEFVSPAPLAVLLE